MNSKGNSRLRCLDALNLVFGHIGDNNLHLFVTTHRQGDLDTIFDIGYRLTGAHRGSVSAEHGIGVLKRGYLHYSRTKGGGRVDAAAQDRRSIQRASSTPGA